MAGLRVLVLNCWGVFIPGAVKYRCERIEAIGEEVAKHQYDVVIFLEVWLKSDYNRLCRRLLSELPYSHYFYSGVIGSGICVFSAHHIEETMFHPYTLNGFAYKPHHGDWFGGKGVGLCRLHLHGLALNLYCSHIHAEYHRGHDEYLSHRVSQAFELSQFVKWTSQSCDLVLVAGDLNIEPTDLGYKIIRTNADLADSWLDKRHTKGYEHGNTCDVPSNSFSVQLPGYPEGKRIDYLLYRSSPGLGVVVEECSVVMNRIPGRDYNYSDHEAVFALFTIEKRESSVCGPVEREQLAERDSLLVDMMETMSQGLKQTQHDQSFFQFQVLVLAVLLYFLELYGCQAPTDGTLSILIIVRLLILAGILLCSWTGFITKRMEIKGFHAVMADAESLLESSSRSQRKH